MFSFANPIWFLFFKCINQNSDKHVSPNKDLKKESVIESEEVEISEGMQDDNDNEHNVEVEDKNKISKQVIDKVAAAIGEKWNILAEKLGYQPDEVPSFDSRILW